MNKTHQHPTGNQNSLTLHHIAEQGQVGLIGLHGIGVVPLNHIVCQILHLLELTASCKILKGADPHMAGGNPRQDGPWKRTFSHDPFARSDGSKSASRGYSQGMHCFADQVFTQHRAHGRFTVAAP